MQEKRPSALNPLALWHYFQRNPQAQAFLESVKNKFSAPQQLKWSSYDKALVRAVWENKETWVGDAMQAKAGSKTAKGILTEEDVKEWKVEFLLPPELSHGALEAFFQNDPQAQGFLQRAMNTLGKTNLSLYDRGLVRGVWTNDETLVRDAMKAKAESKNAKGVLTEEDVRTLEDLKYKEDLEKLLSVFQNASEADAECSRRANDRTTSSEHEIGSPSAKRQRTEGSQDPNPWLLDEDARKEIDHYFNENENPSVVLRRMQAVILPKLEFCDKVLLKAVLSQDMDLAQKALSAGARVFSEVHLVQATLNRNLPMFKLLQSFLPEDSKKINPVGNDARHIEALRIAANQGYLEFMAALLPRAEDKEIFNDHEISEFFRSKRGQGILPLFEAASNPLSLADQALIKAVRCRDLPLAKQALSHEARPNLQTASNMQQTGGRSLLMLAANHGDREMVELLLSFGAERALRDQSGHKAQDYASRKLVLPVFGPQEYNACFLRVVDEFFAQSEQLKKLLALFETPASPLPLSNKLLLKAIATRDLALAQQALRHGANPNLQTANKESLLMLATKLQDHKMRSLLLLSRADEDLQEASNHKALDYASRERPVFGQPVHEAYFLVVADQFFAQSEKLKKLLALFETPASPLPLPDKLFLKAIVTKDFVLAKQALNHGARVNLPLKDCTETLLTHLAYNKNEESVLPCVDFLLLNGADVSEAALNFAQKSGNHRVRQALLASRDLMRILPA